MEEKKLDKILNELDFELEKLEKLIKKEEDINKLIELRIKQKELFLEEIK